MRHATRGLTTILKKEPLLDLSLPFQPFTAPPYRYHHGRHASNATYKDTCNMRLFLAQFASPSDPSLHHIQVPAWAPCLTCTSQRYLEYEPFLSSVPPVLSNPSLQHIQIPARAACLTCASQTYLKYGTFLSSVRHSLPALHCNTYRHGSINGQTPVSPHGKSTTRPGVDDTIT